MTKEYIHGNVKFMQNWTPWNWIAYGSLGITAFLIAIGSTAKEGSALSNWLSPFFKDYILGYGPFVFFMIATVVFVMQLLPFGKKESAALSIEQIMMQSHFNNVDVPIAGLIMAMPEPLLQNKTFEHCTIIGPAILLARNSSFIRDRFEGKIDSLFIATTNKIVWGVIMIDNITFIECDFKKISFIGPPEQMDDMKRRFLTQ